MIMITKNNCNATNYYIPSTNIANSNSVNIIKVCTKVVISKIEINFISFKVLIEINPPDTHYIDFKTLLIVFYSR